MNVLNVLIRYSGSSASGPLSLALALALTEPLIQPYGKAIVWLELLLVHVVHIHVAKL